MKTLQFFFLVFDFASCCSMLDNFIISKSDIIYIYSAIVALSHFR